MPPTTSDSAEAARGAQQPDKDDAAPRPHSDAPNELPPRIVVELPDGELFLGEDDDRLEGERLATAEQVQQSAGRAAQPGTDLWVEIRRLHYATALETLVMTRKRHAAVLLTVDLVYMLMSALRFVVRGTGSSLSESPDDLFQLVQACLGITLDALTLVFVLRNKTAVLRVFALLHLGHFIATAARDWNSVAVFRILVLFFLQRLIAVSVEMKWVLSAQPVAPRSSIPGVDRIQTALMGGALSSLRHEYARAVATVAEEAAAPAAVARASIGRASGAPVYAAPADGGGESGAGAAPGVWPTLSPAVAPVGSSARTSRT